MIWFVPLERVFASQLRPQASAERYENEKRVKAEYYMLTEVFDSPYTEEELDTWIAQANLPVSSLVDLDNLTGGMSGLLRFYGECGGDRQRWLECVGVYEDELWRDFVGKLESKEDVVTAMNMVMGLPPQLAPKIKLSCFYKDVHGGFRLLSPYFRSQAEILLTGKMDKLSDIDLWTKALEVNLKSELAEKNPARITWQLEGLVISTIWLQGRLLDDDNYLFKTYRTYDHGHEVAALHSILLEELRAS